MSPFFPSSSLIVLLYNSDLSGGSAVSTAAAAGFGSGCQQSDRRQPPDQTHGRYWCGQIFAPAAHRRAAACLTRRFVSSQPTRRRAAASKINVSSQTPRRIGQNCTVYSFVLPCPLIAIYRGVHPVHTKTQTYGSKLTPSELPQRLPCSTRHNISANSTWRHQLPKTGTISVVALIAASAALFGCLGLGSLDGLTPGSFLSRAQHPEKELIGRVCSLCARMRV